MWKLVNILFGIIFLTTVHALPVDSDSSSSEENGVVYVMNVYAVRNMKSKEVAKILSKQNVMSPMSPIFEPLGSMLVVDYDGDEPVSLDVIVDGLEEFGATYEKLSNENEPAVYELTFDYEPSLEDLIDYLESEGIIMQLTIDGNATMSIEFDKSIKDPADQPFTLEELAHHFEDEGFEVKTITHNGVITRIEIQSGAVQINKASPTTLRPEKKTDRRVESPIDNEVVRYDERKKEEKPKSDDKFVTLDFLTKDSMNRIRRRRSACPECKAVNMIKELMNRYEATH